MADGAGSGHVGGSSSKTEQILALLTSGVLGFAVLHRSCGLTTKAFVIAGDAESEEGMSYEARNLASTLAVRNLIVTLDYNHFGIDGSTPRCCRRPT
jgi:transketolase N-terminal domain/subunit